MYAGRVASCPRWVCANGTDRQTDAGSLRCAFHYRRGQRDKQKQGVALTGRNTTGPLYMQLLVSYIAYASVTDDNDRRQRPLQVLALYIMCRRASNKQVQCIGIQQFVKSTIIQQILVYYVSS